MVQHDIDNIVSSRFAIDFLVDDVYKYVLIYRIVSLDHV